MERTMKVKLSDGAIVEREVERVERHGDRMPTEYPRLNDDEECLFVAGSDVPLIAKTRG